MSCDFLALAVPGALAGGAMQINSVVSQVLAGSDEGARSVLYNADRLYQLPLGLVGVALGLALVPRLTRAFVSGDHAGGRRTMDDGLGLALAFALPAGVALFVIPFFIIDATVTRAAFTSADAARTADVLRHTDAATGRPFVEVADRGNGVDPAQAERIFEPFFTSGSGGTGLGLFISRELCQTNGALLLYEPRPGGGSIFRIIFADPSRWID